MALEMLMCSLHVSKVSIVSFMRKQVKIYTDGGCRGNPGKGGWGAVLFYDEHSKEISGYAANTTNNQMELTAVIEALRLLKFSCDVIVLTDSKYVCDGVVKWLPNWKQKNWRTAANKPVKNVQLWQQLDVLLSKHSVRWEWLKGHNGDTYNERADWLANQAMDAKELDRI